MPLQLLTDADVHLKINPALAVGVAKHALVSSHNQTLQGSPRLESVAGETSLVFTAGGLAGGPTGFRVYGRWPDRDDQVVVVWSPGGRLRGIIIGRALGDYRTGALGGAAVDALAGRNASVLAVVGTGRMAWTQVWAACHVRQFEQVRVFSRTPGNAARFSARVTRQYGIPATAAANAEEAVRDADVVIVSTVATEPVVYANWLKPGCHVNSTGPKWGGASELDPEIAEMASVIVSDSPAQASAMPPPWFTDAPLQHLGGVIAGTLPGRRDNSDVTLYCSIGLAGSEVLLAERLLETAAASIPFL